MSLAVMLPFSRRLSRPWGGRGQGLLSLGGLRFCSFSHFFQQALRWMARLLVPNLNGTIFTIFRRYSRRVLWAYSLNNNPQSNNLNMLVHRINAFKDRKIQASDISTEPHGEFLSVFIDKKLYLVSILAILQHFSTYREEFAKTGKYSIGREMTHMGVISPQVVTQHTTILFSQKNQERMQYVVFAQSRQVEIVKIKVSDKYAKTINTLLFKVDHDIMHTNIIGFKVYLTLYNFTMSVIDITTGQLRGEKNMYLERSLSRNEDSVMSTPETKKTFMQKEIARFTQGEDFLWQKACGHLMRGDRPLAYELEEKLDITNSIEEFEYAESKQGTPVKYQLSDCRRYLVGSNSFSINNVISTLQSHFIIRSQKFGWDKIQTFEWTSKPEINPYWSQYYLGKENVFKKSKSRVENKLNGDRMMVAEYSYDLDVIIVSWLLVSSNRKKTEEKSWIDPQLPGCYKKWYSCQKIVIAFLSQLKHKINRLKWVGLMQLAWVEAGGQLMFMELSPDYLQYK